jgi:hypothetical protein
MSQPNVNAVKSALYTALWTFIAVALGLLTGWLGQVIEALSSDEFILPDPSGAVKAIAAAAVAGFSGVVAVVIRLIQANSAFPGQPPSYPGTPPAP